MVPLIWASGYTAGVHGLAQSEVKAHGRKILQNGPLVTTLNQRIKKNLRPREVLKLWIAVPWEGQSFEKSIRP